MSSCNHRASFSPPLIVVVFLGLFLCRCMVGPNFERPGTEVSAEWLEAGDKRVTTAPSGYRDWWSAFDDPILDRVIARAYRENLSLRIAGLRVLAARAQLGIAAGEFYPQTQQSFGSLQYNRPSNRSAATTAGITPEFWQSEIGFSASWELDFWGKFRRSIESADAGWQATLADYDSVLVSLTADVANSYILIRTLQKRIEIARRNVEIQNESLQIAEARFKYGTVTQLDVEQAQTVLNNSRASIPALETQLRQAENALCVLLGFAPSHLTDLLEGPSEIPVSPPQVIVGIPADLLRRRPDVRSAEYRAAAQCALIGAAKADLYPAFSLNGTFGFLATDLGNNKLSDMFQWPSRTFQTGPTFSWSLFNYGRITNNVRVQDAFFQELVVGYQNTVLAAQQDVEDNLAAFLKSQDRAEFLGRAVTAAQKSFDLAVLQYREGVVDFTTVLIAQQALLNEQDSLATTLGNISSSLVGVYRALGGGWEIREGKDLVSPATAEEMKRRTNWGSLLTPGSYNPPGTEKPNPSIRAPDW
jgi:NodT family efflux transporter outer membrane factor (OMF) lipoprotein